VAVGLLVAAALGYLWKRAETDHPMAALIWLPVMLGLLLVVGLPLLLWARRVWRRSPSTPGRLFIACVAAAMTGVLTYAITPATMVEGAIARIRFTTPANVVWVVRGRCFDYGDHWFANLGGPRIGDGRWIGASLQSDGSGWTFDLVAQREIEGGHVAVDTAYKGPLSLEDVGDASVTAIRNRASARFSATPRSAAALELWGQTWPRLEGSVEWACSGSILEPLPDFGPVTTEVGQPT